MLDLVLQFKVKWHKNKFKNWDKVWKFIMLIILNSWNKLEMQMRCANQEMPKMLLLSYMYYFVVN